MKSTLIESCAVCGKRLETALELPRLPLTGIYRREGMIESFPSYDQALLICTNCEHGQLQAMLDPDVLYGNAYGFRTSASITASRGAEFFADFLDQVAPGTRFSRVLEFGCSDAVLLKKLRARASRLVGVDPVLSGREDESPDSNITLIGARIQDLDVNEALGGTPDLVVSQHTMEHLPDPRGTLEKLMRAATADTLFVLEFPCLDPLLEQLRFDQVFHQHVQYFSVRSFLTLLTSVGATLARMAFHYTYWGSLLVAFRKGRDTTQPRTSGPSKSVDAVRARYDRFRAQLEGAAEALADCSAERVFGYGAALMLPVLAYHLHTDFSTLEAVFDDDPAKEGFGYANLPVRIRNPGGVDFTDLTVLLTAMDNRRPILRRLAELNPKRIINPLCFI